MRKINDDYLANSGHEHTKAIKYVKTIALYQNPYVGSSMGFMIEP